MKHPIPKTEKKMRNALSIDDEDELSSFLLSFLLNIKNRINTTITRQSTTIAELHNLKLFNIVAKSVPLLVESAISDKTPFALQGIADNKNVKKTVVIANNFFFISDSFMFLLYNLPQIADKINRKIYNNKI